MKSLHNLAMIGLVVSVNTLAQTHQHNPEHHKGMSGEELHLMTSAPIKEVGQAQFAAIAEIVDTLRSDPDTDWSQVNIDALREHLIDMDNVTTKADVETSVQDDVIQFKVTGTDNIIGSIQRMITAHSTLLQNDSGWNVIAKITNNGANMIIKTEDEALHRQLLGLGFFGIMTVGGHHQIHHLMIATGTSPH